jgi:hypothetical protein
MTALSWSALVIGATLTLLLLAFVVRRLIGVRVPVPRTLAAGVVAVLVFSPIVTAMIGGPGFPRKGSVLPALWFVILGVVIALLAGMVFLVIAEALVPSGSVPGPVYVLRAARGRMGRAGRYGQISRIMARRGLLPYARGGRRSELATPEGRARLERSTSWGRAVGAAGLAAGFAAALREELDLRVEARNMTSVAAASDSRGSDGIAIPVPYQPLCTARVLVMERLDGRPLAAIDARTPADVRAALARSLLDCLLRQVMLEGTFHAAPHPGNVLLLADGRLALRVLVLVFRPDTR